MKKINKLKVFRLSLVMALVLFCVWQILELEAKKSDSESLQEQNATLEQYLQREESLMIANMSQCRGELLDCKAAKKSPPSTPPARPAPSSFPFRETSKVAKCFLPGYVFSQDWK